MSFSFLAHIRVRSYGPQLVLTDLCHSAYVLGHPRCGQWRVPPCLVAEQCSTGCGRVCRIRSPVAGHLGCLHVLATVITPFQCKDCKCPSTPSIAKETAALEAAQATLARNPACAPLLSFTLPSLHRNLRLFLFQLRHVLSREHIPSCPAATAMPAQARAASVLLPRLFQASHRKPPLDGPTRRGHRGTCQKGGTASPVPSAEWLKAASPQVKKPSVHVSNLKNKCEPLRNTSRPVS